MDLTTKWSVFVGDLRHTAVIAMTLAAVVAIVVTWSRRRSFAPTAAVILVGSVAVWGVSHPDVITRLVERETDEARTEHLEDEDLGEGRDVDLGG